MLPSQLKNWELISGGDPRCEHQAGDIQANHSIARRVTTAASISADLIETQIRFSDPSSSFDEPSKHQGGQLVPMVDLQNRNCHKCPLFARKHSTPNNHMKSKTAAALLFLFPIIFSTNTFAQYETVMSTGTSPLNITIPSGQVLQVLNFIHDTDGYGGRLSFKKGNTTVRTLSSSSPGGSPLEDYPPASYFVGPGTLTMTGTETLAKLCLTYKLFDNTNAPSGTSPSNAVVIPADATGPVKVILESSTDLITWTEALPGSYGNSTSKRFFRVRAVAQ